MLPPGASAPLRSEVSVTLSSPTTVSTGHRGSRGSARARRAPGEAVYGSGRPALASALAALLLALAAPQGRGPTGDAAIWVGVPKVIGPAQVNKKKITFET